MFKFGFVGQGLYPWVSLWLGHYRVAASLPHQRDF